MSEAETLKTRHVRSANSWRQWLPLKGLHLGLRAQRWQRKRVEPSLEQARASLDKLGEKRFNALPGLSYRAEKIDHLNLEWMTPHSGPVNKVIFYLHGGGYCLGSIQAYRPMMSRVAYSSQRQLCAVDYRLAPEYPYPAGLDDALQVYRVLLERFGAESIVVMGDSAGGGLSLALLLRVMQQKLEQPAGLVLLSPWTDLTLQSPSLYSHAKRDPLFSLSEFSEVISGYVQENDPSNSLISPVFGDFIGFPPTFIQVGTEEILIDDSLRLVKALNRDQVVGELEIWQGMSHVWQFYAPLLEASCQAIDHIATFTKSKI
ncbi:alpha/beta hydrolase [Piscirickettsia litoralis]|uniref:Alpha/beta hydrolase fold-3 domain-containing protein n=1 Tax=Piscirickettsia litoralis TaxID=1891921 RepID=A0ABX3A7I0_9GAMM|nr:alpha/beta hydrolase [Piscirickettsia litoralis]ODN43475.1 hypothetical protein BGC07_11790 [Piscirickettsia litoralis]